MQKAYINSLYSILKDDPRVVSVLSDSGTDYDELLSREFPKQCINMGISEETLIGASAGLASMGMIPFVYTSGAFLAYRAFEFIRDDVCLQNSNVKIVGMGSGLSWSTLGPSHHTTEDISVLRVLPNLVLLSPSTPIELRAMVKFAYEYDGPVYIRMGMSKEQEFFDEDYQFKLGKCVELTKGDELAFLVTGSILSEVMEAVKLLQEQDIRVGVINVPTLKPLNKSYMLELCKKYKKIVTVEEHNIYGGLGGIVSEMVIDYELGISVRKIGLNDKFAYGYGTHREVLEQNRLTSKYIAEYVREWMK